MRGPASDPANILELLSAHAVLNGGVRRYWQFSTNDLKLRPLDPEAVYIDAEYAADLKTLLSEHVRWFIADGTTRLGENERVALEQSLRTLSRMPDEGKRTHLWEALAHWLAERATQTIYVRMQRFR